VIADVATDPAPPARALEEAVGRVNPIYVVVPMVDADGTSYLQVTKGAVFSYYEFPWPIADRLTDEKWRGMLDDGTAPAPPEWTSSFLVDEIEYADLSMAVHMFHIGVTSDYWYLSSDDLAGGGPGFDAIKADIARLTAQKQYMGHQLLASEFRSFDLQSPTLAVVTAHETWQDTLYGLTEYSPDSGDAVIAQRGPYTLDPTYTLELADRGQGPEWKVTNVVYANQPPDFPQ
jgi:hypothetical protein